MNDTEYLMNMLSQLISAELRRGTEQDGNWGWPSFHEELEEMKESLSERRKSKDEKR